MAATMVGAARFRRAEGVGPLQHLEAVSQLCPLVLHEGVGVEQALEVLGTQQFLVLCQNQDDEGQDDPEGGVPVLELSPPVVQQRFPPLVPDHQNWELVEQSEPVSELHREGGEASERKSALRDEKRSQAVILSARLLSPALTKSLERETAGRSK